MDVISTSIYDGKLAWYENNGNGTFDIEHGIFWNIAMYDMFIIDIDSDNDLDIVSVATSPISGDESYIYWHENDGVGNFIENHLIEENSSGTQAVTAADFDNDGDMDLAVTGGNIFYPIHLRWFENDGNENFDSQGVAPSVPSGRSIRSADIDGDQDMDILVAFSGHVIWFENDGLGDFTNAQTIISSSGFKSIDMADLDNDGHLDVLVGSSYGIQLSWFKNDGSGLFGEQNIVETSAVYVNSVHAVDIDSDGDMDVLSASEDDNKIAWYENNGLGIFGIEQVISIDAIEAKAVSSSDLDNDGDMDILSASLADDKIAWYENVIAGCTNTNACNFNSNSIIDDASCIWPPCSACDGDIDGDGEVGTGDLLSLLSNMGCLNPPGPCQGDLNLDGIVNVSDLLFLVSYLNEDCE